MGVCFYIHPNYCLRNCFFSGQHNLGKKFRSLTQQFRKSQKQEIVNNSSRLIN